MMHEQYEQKKRENLYMYIIHGVDYQLGITRHLSIMEVISDDTCTIAIVLQRCLQRLVLFCVFVAII